MIPLEISWLMMSRPKMVEGVLDGSQDATLNLMAMVGTACGFSKGIWTAHARGPYLY